LQFRGEPGASRPQIAFHGREGYIHRASNLLEREAAEVSLLNHLCLPLVQLLEPGQRFVELRDPITCGST
jgi:hypothetical protein